MAQEAARRTAAILNADVIGLARGTVAKSDWTARLTQHCVERLEPTVARHGGRVIEVTDEGVRAEFPSAAQALGAAIAFQQAMADANHEEDADSAVVFSLGLHLAEAGWPIKQPSKPTAGGNIGVSASPSDSLADRVKASFAELGSAGLGTVERPVHTYEVGRDPADWPAASAAAAQGIPQNGRKRTNLWPVLVAALVALGVFYLADAPRSPPAVASVPRRATEELQRLQEDAVAAFAFWREGKAQEEAEPDEPAGPDAKADNAVPTDGYDGVYMGTFTIRPAGHLGTIAVRVSHGVGSGTQSRLECGTAPVSLRISSSGDVSGRMLVFGSTCLRTELAINGSAVPGTLRLRFGSQYVELVKRD